MSRVLTLTSLGLVLLGLEASAETFSTTLDRLLTGASALAHGGGHVVSPERFAVGLALLLLGVGLALLLVWGRFAVIRVEGTGRVCPVCETETTRIRRKLRHRLLAYLVREKITRRRCGGCGWTGLSLDD